MNQLSLRNHQLKFKSPRALLMVILEEFRGIHLKSTKEAEKGEEKNTKQNHKMSTGNHGWTWKHLDLD
jgi:hypothetical protein